MPELLDIGLGSIGELVLHSMAAATSMAPVSAGRILEHWDCFWGRSAGNRLGVSRCGDGRRSTVHFGEYGVAFNKKQRSHRALSAALIRAFSTRQCAQPPAWSRRSSVRLKVQ